MYAKLKRFSFLRLVLVSSTLLYTFAKLRKFTEPTNYYYYYYDIYILVVMDIAGAQFLLHICVIYLDLNNYDISVV